jgi:inositol 1,4,5-triphosphate receptor type 1/inositol 1,4,5-triphosphate receptor type 3
MVARFQMKCLILILSLIEMRELTDQNPIIKRIMRNLPMSLLQRHLSKNYKLYT